MRLIRTNPDTETYNYVYEYLSPRWLWIVGAFASGCVIGAIFWELV